MAEVTSDLKLENAFRSMVISGEMLVVGAGGTTVGAAAGSAHSGAATVVTEVVTS
jgi:shikimate 5-dehydrogenase